jgi:hypothetical protein
LPEPKEEMTPGHVSTSEICKCHVEGRGLGSTTWFGE